MRWLLLLLLLTGCGGGGGNSSNPPVPPAITNHALFGYFGIGGNQIAETAGHVDYVHMPDWGNWDDPKDRERITLQTIGYLQEARARGISRAVVSIGYLVFDSHFHYRGTAEFAAFWQRLNALDLARNVIAVYPVDEPELHGLTDASLLPVLADIKRVWPIPLAVVYGDTKVYPGISAYDWIGRDNYGMGAGVLNTLPPIRDNQRWIIVPGGADPWRQEVQPFREFAQSHNVALIMAFIWLDNWGGTPNKGIRSNGMAATYQG